MTSSRVLRLRAIALVDRGLDTLLTRFSREGHEAGAEESGLGRRAFLSSSASSLALALLAGCDSQGPRSAERLLAYATRKNEAIERWLLRHTSMDHGSPGGVIAGDRFPSYFVSPTVPMYDPVARGPWVLEVGGMVRTPLRLTLDELIALPRTEQRVNHFCVEGWNAVARFAGVPLREIAQRAGVLPGAAVVDFESFDNAYHESWDLESALHPQTLIVYAKDGTPLSPAYGAPARVHSPIKLGYKNTKYLTRVMFLAERNGGYWSDKGYEWYGGT
jgi:DMSO/TMAO reductase YedYZ molybdopterin-dependent catalytic subunit